MMTCVRTTWCKKMGNVMGKKGITYVGISRVIIYKTSNQIVVNE
jgi:hypothetical protein